MKKCDIMEAFVAAVENVILKEWRHEGFIGGCTSDGANFVIDNREYFLKLKEVSDGELGAKRTVKNELPTED